MYVYSISFFKIHFPRNKYRIVFKKSAICSKLYFITNIEYYYKLYLY